MSLLHILIFALLALGYGALFKDRRRSWVLLIASVLALYWLQPATPIRTLDFWLPTAALSLTVIVWAATQPSATHRSADTLTTLLILLGLIFLISLNRYIEPCCLTPSRPPDPLRVVIALVFLAALLGLISYTSPQSHLLVAIYFLLLTLLTLKTAPLAQLLSAGLRTLVGQSPAQAAALDIRWLGFSYLAFRLIHALRERMLNKLPQLALSEFITYVIFFPALTAGPIDRAERFVKDLRASRALTAPVVLEGGRRLVWGLFKKFALADTLALIALNGVNATQTTSGGWLWVLLYAYALRIYFDFSGYTDIALGLAKLLGVNLPENFNQPYRKQNLTAFWNSWHITLAHWFRAYYFNPLTRALRARNLPPTAVILLTQFTTMILIGLWHGVAWNFVAWGAWHGAGLFIHNRWADFIKPRTALFDDRPWLKRAATWSGVAFTFHYVGLGWVWFALPDIGLAGRVMLKLFGL
jgi:D-alanyl-lipoteichoic acid acyltransferase DltB (MBOAT superfamily)